jgi:hypothetical protein
LRPGYGKAIEHRLSLVETTMDKMSQSIQDILVHVRPDLDRANTSVATALHDDTNSSTAWTAVEANTDTQTWTQPPQLAAMTPFTALAPIIDRIPPSMSMPPLQNAASGLPSATVMQELVDLFFDLVHPWIPMFCKLNFTTNMFVPDHEVLLHALVAVTFRFWTKPVPTPKEREELVKASREQVLLKTINVCSLVSTQALALMALDSLGEGPGPRTWNAMSMLVTASKHLGLSRSPLSPTTPETTTPLVRNEDDDDGAGVSHIAMEEKRRLFWVIYSLDRFSSASHGQPGGVDARNIRLPYPAGEQDWGQYVMPEWFQLTATQPTKLLNHAQCPSSLWHHNIDALAMMDRANQLLIKPLDLSLPAHCQEWQSMFRRLDITMSTWFENLPHEVRERPAVFNPMWVMLHATFQL